MLRLFWEKWLFMDLMDIVSMSLSRDLKDRFENASLSKMFLSPASLSPGPAPGFS